MSNFADELKVRRKTGLEWARTVRMAATEVKAEYDDLFSKKSASNIVDLSKGGADTLELTKEMRLNIIRQRESLAAVDTSIADEITNVGDVSLEFLLGIQDDLRYQYEYPASWATIAWKIQDCINATKK